MPKFYVRSGQFCRVIDRPNVAAAARAAVRSHAFDAEAAQSKAMNHLEPMTVVSERGFQSGDCITFDTHYLLTGQIFGKDVD